MHRIARTPEEETQLAALSTMFNELYHRLLEWTQGVCEDGDLAKLPPQETAVLELFDAAWCLFDGHTRDSSYLKERLGAVGERYHFDIVFHLPIDAEEGAWLKAHGIAPADEGKL